MMPIIIKSPFITITKPDGNVEIRYGQERPVAKPIEPKIDEPVK